MSKITVNVLHYCQSLRHISYINEIEMKLITFEESQMWDTGNTAYWIQVHE